jgi:hypothetical protein
MNEEIQTIIKFQIYLEEVWGIVKNVLSLFWNRDETRVSGSKHMKSAIVIIFKDTKQDIVTILHGCDEAQLSILCAISCFGHFYYPHLISKIKFSKVGIRKIDAFWSL